MAHSDSAPYIKERRVLIIVQNLPVPFDRRVWQEACELKANGYRVSVICPKGHGHDASYECLNGVHIYRHPLPLEAHGTSGYLLEYGASLFWEFCLTWKVFFTRGFDAIHACNPPDDIFLIGALFKYVFRKKFLFDHHDLTPELYEAKFGKRGFFYHLMRIGERLTFATADIVISTNESYRRIAVERGHVASEKLFVVRSGPNLDRMHTVPPSTALKRGRTFLVSYVGVMGHQEGIAYLIEAARHIIHDLGRQDIQFILAGSGPALEEMKRLAASSNLTDYMTFTGRIGDEALLEMLSTADICVNPDEVNAMNDKSTMNKIMEYMALGKPIVQFDVREGRVSAGDASLYARPNDARDFAEKILWLIEHPAQREAMGRIGRGRIENALAWPHEAPKLLAAYDALFAQRSFAERVKWYRHRLGAMSGAEVLHRMRETVRRRLDRYAMVPAAHDLGTLPALPALRAGLEAWLLPEALLKQPEQSYRDAQRGQYVLLGKQWPQATSADKWHLDPVTRRPWPQDRYCFAIDYRHAPGYGDVKYVWELNRLQYLQPIAALALARKDDAIAAFCFAEIDSWIASNPPHRGVNWASGIELALRTVSMLVVTSLVGEHATPAQRTRIWGTLEAHAYWLERYLSRFSSANNHLAAEGLGLFLIGTLCPRFVRAQHWKTRGWQMLCDASATQILPDGCGAEQTVAYTAFVAEMLLCGRHVALAHNIAVPHIYNERLMLAGEYLRWLTDSGGQQPHIGDDDNACVLGCYQRGNAYVTSILGSIAAVFDRADLSPPGNTPHLRQALFGKPPAPQTAPVGVRTFNEGGMTVGRHPFRGHEVMLAIDHGPLGYLSIAAHGHADALALWLHIDNQPVLTDAGTYLYHAGGSWRDYFRGTQAHNTLSIQGGDSSTMTGPFNWSRKARAQLVSCNWQEDNWRLEATHDGYRHAFSAIHSRRLDVTAAGFAVEDSLLAGQPHQVFISYLLHPSLTAVRGQRSVEIRKDNRVLLHLGHNGPLYCTVDTQGWYSASFGHKEPATRIIFHGWLAPDQKAISYFSWNRMGQRARSKTTGAKAHT